MDKMLVVYIQRLEGCCTLILAGCTSLIRAVLTSLEEWCRGFQCKRWRDSSWRGRQRRGDGAPSRTHWKEGKRAQSECTVSSCAM